MIHRTVPEQAMAGLIGLARRPLPMAGMDQSQAVQLVDHLVQVQGWHRATQ